MSRRICFAIGFGATILLIALLCQMAARGCCVRNGSEASPETHGDSTVSFGTRTELLDSASKVGTIYGSATAEAGQIISAHSQPNAMLRQELQQAAQQRQAIGQEIAGCRELLAKRDSQLLLLERKLREAQTAAPLGIRTDPAIDCGELLAAARRQITMLQIDHNIRTLFVMDNFLSSPLANRHEFDRSAAKSELIRYFDICAVAMGWSERYCEVRKLIYGVNAGAQFISLRRGMTRHNLAGESLYFLCKAARYDPGTIRSRHLKEIVTKAFAEYESERALSFEKITQNLTGSGIEAYANSMAERLTRLGRW